MLDFKIAQHINDNKVIDFFSFRDKAWNSSALWIDFIVFDSTVIVHNLKCQYFSVGVLLMWMTR